MKSIESAFNKGIPKFLPFVIANNLLEDNCSANEKKYKAFNDKAVESVYSILEGFGYVYPLLPPTFEVVVNDYDLKSYLTVSSVYLSQCIDTLLDIDITEVDYDTSVSPKQRINNKIRELQKIRTPKQLKEKFPTFDKLFAAVANNYAAYNTYRFFEDYLKKSDPLTYNQYKQAKKVVESYGLDKLRSKDLSMLSFIEKFTKCVKNILSKDNYEYINKIITSHGFSYDDLECLDTYKTEMFMAGLNLSYAYANEDCRIACVSYLNKFFKEVKENSENYDGLVVDVLLFEDKKHPTPYRLDVEGMYNKYRDLLINNPSIKLIDFNIEDYEGMTLNQVNEKIKADLEEMEISWDILKSDDNLDLEVLRGIRTRAERMPEEKREEEIEKAYQLYIEKKEYFDSLDTYARIKGKEKFDGYIGYLLANGIVILEKYFDNVNTGRVTKGNAIYVMNSENFMELSKKGKTEIMNGKLCQRVTHHKGWQGKLSEVLKNSDLFTNRESIKKMIKEI